MDTSFVPDRISTRGGIWLKSLYVSVAISCIATFIIGIAQTKSIYVMISVLLALGITIGGCLFTRCYNRWYHKYSTSEYAPLQKNNDNQTNYA